jgi:hypothetical protein
MYRTPVLTPFEYLYLSHKWDAPLANNAEIARIYKEQQPLSSGNIQRAELDIRRAQIQEKNSNLQQNYQIKCSK